MVHTAEDYRYSGHRVYADGQGSEVLEMLGGKAQYRKFLLEGSKDGHRDEYYRVEDQRFLGSEDLARS